MNKVEQYVENIALGVDETLNALAGGDGRETISSRVGKMAEEGKPGGHLAEEIVNTIMDNPQHCQQSIEPEVGDKAIIPD